MRTHLRYSRVPTCEADEPSYLFCGRKNTYIYNTKTRAWLWIDSPCTPCEDHHILEMDVKVPTRLEKWRRLLCFLDFLNLGFFQRWLFRRLHRETTFVAKVESPADKIDMEEIRRLWEKAK